MFISFFADQTGRLWPAAALIWNYILFDAIFEKYLTAENAEVAESFIKKFLGVLCELRGELLCFFFDLTGRLRPAAALIRISPGSVPQTLDR